MYLDNCLGRFDIAFATSAMKRFKMMSREGHLKAAKRILDYLKTIADTAYPDHSISYAKEHSQIGWHSIQMLRGNPKIPSYFKWSYS